MPISAYILTKNEEKYIRQCIESIKDVVDEIIIVDGYSVDKTLDICREYTDKIYQHKFSGFSGERIFAVSKTSHDWVLQIDADETLSKKLQDDLKDIVNHCFSFNAIAFARRNYYDKEGKKWTKYAYYPDYQIRLFKKDKVRFDLNRTVLDGALVDGRIGYRIDESYLNHYVPNKYEMSNFKNQHLRSAKLQAKWWSGGRRHWMCLLKIPFVYLHHFLKMTLFSRWYRDGIIGLKASSIMAFYMVMVNYYMVFDDDRIPLLLLSLFKSPNQDEIDKDYKIKIWKDL